MARTYTKCPYCGNPTYSVYLSKDGLPARYAGMKYCEKYCEKCKKIVLRITTTVIREKM